MLLDDCLELSDELGIPPALKVGFNTALERGEPKFLEPRYFWLRPRLISELGEGGASPEREGCSEFRGPVQRGELRSDGEQPLELGAVERLGTDVEPVAACVGHDRLLPERLSEM